MMPRVHRHAEMYSKIVNAVASVNLERVKQKLTGIDGGSIQCLWKR